MGEDYKIILVLVGLPGSGKSYTANHVKNYFNWLGYPTEIFNCGSYRRKIFGADHNLNLFNHENNEGNNLRNICFYYSIFDLNVYLRKKNTQIAIFDATNTTILRRKKIINFFNLFDYKKKIIFIENITKDKKIIEDNILFKKNSLDYKSYNLDFIKKDFKERINLYNNIYQTINDDENLNYIKSFDCGKKVIYESIYGEREYLLLSYLINFKLIKKKIFITRHGESLFNVESRIGGDANLTDNGIKYSKNLYNYISKSFKPSEIVIFTSNLKRTINTAKYFKDNNYEVINKEILNEIDGGICENMSYFDVEKKWPELISKRNKDKFNFKYPEGESYYDVIKRINDFILEINRIEKNILIISHRAIVRCILGYFMNYKKQDIPYIEIPLHKINLIEKDLYFYKLKSITIN